MIKADELQECRPQVRCKNGEEITLSKVQDAIMSSAQQKGIPVEFRKDQVKSGGLFNSSVEDCVVMFHPDHERDYLNFCIRVKHQGTYAFVIINDFGQSKQLGMINFAEDSKADRRGKSMSYKVGSMIAQGILTIGKNTEKAENEQNYYNCVADIFDETFS